ARARGRAALLCRLRRRRGGARARPLAAHRQAALAAREGLAPPSHRSLKAYRSLKAQRSMTTTHPELAESVRRLFEELIELPWDARRVRLAKTRADDPELALRVEALLTAADDAPEFLERPALESELVGHAAGPWILEERLSSGGGGDVYRARRADGDGWRVALKVL